MAGRRRKGEAPAMRHHKASGQAYVYVDGKSVYLGEWGSAEARREYRDLIKRWELAERPAAAAMPRRGAVVTVADLVALFLDFADRHYVHPDGTPTGHAANFQPTTRAILELHAARSIEDIDGRDVREIVSAWAQSGKSKHYVNQCLYRFKKIVRWGLEQELVSESAAGRLCMVPGLSRGVTYNPICPVPAGDLDKTLAVLDDAAPEVAAATRLQYLAGPRPGEASRFKAAELHREAFTVEGRQVTIPPELVVFIPSRHKTQWRGQSIFYVLGPRAQAVVSRWESFPTIADDYPEYAAAIHRAAVKAGVPVWIPGQLRHNFLTRWDATEGTELASIAVQHRKLSTSAGYIQRDLDRLAGPAARLG